MYEEESNRNRNVLVAVLGVLFAAALVIIFFVKAHKPEAVAAPSSLKAYLSVDKTFACSVPADWKRQETGGMGIMSGLDVHKASADIKISSDLQGSLMGDMTRASNAQAESQIETLDSSLSPGLKSQNGTAQRIRPAVEQLHDAGMISVASEVENYEEKPAQEIKAALGEARLSEWTGETKELLSTLKIHGYRATILGTDRRFIFVAKCHESDWPQLKTSFMTVLGSLKSGGG